MSAKMLSKFTHKKLVFYCPKLYLFPIYLSFYVQIEEAILPKDHKENIKRIHLGAK